MISKLRSFWADERGAYAMTFAIVAIPVIGAAAAAVEFSSVSKVRFHLQHALDTAALATAKELPVSDDSAYLQAYARNFFDANLNPVITPSEVTFGFQLSQVPGQGTRVILSANLTYDTYMAGVIGVEEIELDVRSVVAAGNRTIEIAIVVDNSGSMDTETGSSGYTRMEKAREAATQLINSLHTIAAYSNKPDPVRIAVVPFGSSVNVGPQYREPTGSTCAAGLRSTTRTPPGSPPPRWAATTGRGHIRAAAAGSPIRHRRPASGRRRRAPCRQALLPGTRPGFRAGHCSMRSG